MRTWGIGIWALAAGAMVAYAATFVLLFPVLGSQAGILTTLPVVLAGWFLGLRGGLATGLLAAALIAALVIIVLDTPLGEWALAGGLLGSAALVLVGGVTGWLHDMKAEMAAEAAMRREAEERLGGLYAELDDLVRERTVELSVAKTALEQEIVERKRVAVETRASEARFSEIIEIAHDAVISMNQAQRITLFNQGAERIFGYRARDIVGEPLELILPSRFAVILRQHIQDFESSTTVVKPMNERQGILGVRKDGTEFPAEATISKIVQDGETIFTVMLRDVTERKMREEVLRVTNLRLEEALRNLREAQTQIVQQERLRALGEMAAGIAHDFNNELTPILGFTELLLDQPENLDKKDRVVQDLQSINTAARNAAEVVRRLRAFYRPPEDTETFALIDFKPLAEQAAKFTQPK